MTSQRGKVPVMVMQVNFHVPEGSAVYVSHILDLLLPVLRLVAKTLISVIDR